MDQIITRWINTFAGSYPLIDAIVISATQFGVPFLVFLVILQWWSKRERLYVRHVCVAAGLAFLLGLGLNQIVLLFVHRVRPYDAGVSHLISSRSGDWSFPSDHATATIAIAATFLIHKLPKRGLAFLAGASLVCLTRIYVGTHYLGDILGGVVTGLATSVAVRFLYRENTRLNRFVTGIF